MEYWRTSAATKAPFVVEYLQERVRTHPEEHIAVFCHHESVRLAISAAFPHAVVIHGGTPVKHRQGIVDRLAKGSVKMGVFSMTACAAGLNMTPLVTHIVMAETIWTPSIALQAEARAHRLGATNDILVTYLDAQGSIDSRVLQMNLDKLAVNTRILGSGSGMQMDSTTTREFRGTEFLKMGCHSNFASVDPSCAPLAGEPQGDWVRRVCVCIDADDFIDTTEKRDIEVASEEFTSLEVAGTKIGDRVWLLLRATLAEITEIRSLATSFEKSQAAGMFELCCAFV